MSRFLDFQTTYPPSRNVVSNVINDIRAKMDKIAHPVKVMHICGTHEATVARSGMRSLLPANLRVISGPGCPVCVCPSEHVAEAISLSKNSIITTFGDMIKVPDATLTTLAKTKAMGGDIRVVYSVSDAVQIAKDNPDRNIVWLGIGFETTAPMTSFTLEKKPPDNFFVLSDFRLVPPAMHLLASDPEFDINGFVLPGHVSTIIGTEPYEEFPKKYKLPCVVAGFDPVDFMISIDKILDQIISEEYFVDNAYPRVVKSEGNIKAINSMKNVFKIADAKWRGIGTIGKSGYLLNKEYENYDARVLLDEPIIHNKDLQKGCLCGKVILGKIEPEACGHFLKRCTPETAIGPCMVSDEGTCRIRASYRNIDPLTS